MHVNPSCRIHSAGVAAPAGLSSYFKAMVRQLHSCEDSWVASAHGLRLSGGQLSCCSQRGVHASATVLSQTHGVLDCVLYCRVGMNSKGLAIAFQVGAGSLCDMAQPFCSADSLVSSLIEVPDGCGGELAVNPSAVVAWTCPARNSSRQSDTSACCCLQAQTEN